MGEEASKTRKGRRGSLSQSGVGRVQKRATSPRAQAAWASLSQELCASLSSRAQAQEQSSLFPGLCLLVNSVSLILALS